MGITRIPANGDLITSDGRTSQYVAAGHSDDQTIHLDVQSVATTTGYMLIDLSNTGVWKHTNTGHINLEYLVLEIDPDATFLGEVEIGFLANVNATDGDFHKVFDLDMAKKSDLIIETINFGLHGLDCETTRHFGPIDADSVVWQTDVNLGGPDDPGTGTYPAGNGDLVMLVTRNGGEVDVSVTIGYETVA